MTATATLTRPSRTVRLQERTALSTNRIDRDNKILYEVKVLGRHSRNGREYLPAVMRGAVHLYDGVKVCLEHLSQGRKKELVGDCVGVLRNPKFKSDAIFANLHLLKNHPRSEYILDIAENVPNSIGLSHDAEGTTRRGSGRDDEVVVSLEKINSVDLVASPASVGGLFESGNRGQVPIASDYPKTHADFVRAMKRTPLPTKVVASHKIRETKALTESSPLKRYPISHAGFVEAMKKPVRTLVNGKPIALLKRPTRRLREQDGFPIGDMPAGQTTHSADGQLCEICEILDDENLSDAQKIERIEAFVGREKGAQLNEFRKILVKRLGDAQKLDLIAAHVDEERVTVEESFVRQLKRGSRRR